MTLAESLPLPKPGCPVLEGQVGILRGTSTKLHLARRFQLDDRGGPTREVDVDEEAGFGLRGEVSRAGPGRSAVDTDCGSR